MINLLVVTHGNFGREIVKSAEMVIGNIDNIESISFCKGESYNDLLTSVKDKINELSKEGLIVFTDMYGGSPFNAVENQAKKENFYHITGINFPLFLDIAINRNTYTMEDIANKIIKNGKKSILFVNERFKFD